MVKGGSQSTEHKCGQLQIMKGKACSSSGWFAQQQESGKSSFTNHVISFHFNGTGDTRSKQLLNWAILKGWN